MKILFSDGTEHIPSRQMALLLYALSQQEQTVTELEYGTVKIHFSPTKADIKFESSPENGRFTIDKLTDLLA